MNRLLYLVLALGLLAASSMQAVANDVIPSPKNISVQLKIDKFAEIITPEGGVDITASLDPADGMFHGAATWWFTANTNFNCKVFANIIKNVELPGNEKWFFGVKDVYEVPPMGDGSWSFFSPPGRTEGNLKFGVRDITFQADASAPIPNAAKIVLVLSPQ